MKQEHRRFTQEEEADMGIGTMIVFIAMILVSAVAAGLLINTAYEVQQQAEETGRIAVLNVATSFQIINAIGDRDITGSGSNEATIRGLELKIGLVAGSPDTLMDNVIIEITTATLEENLFFDTNAALQHDWNDHDATDTSSLKAAATAGTDYTAQELRDPNSDFYESTATASDYVVSQGGLLRVFISLNSPYIDTQDWILVKIIPKHGAPTVWQGTAPESLTDRYIPL